MDLDDGPDNLFFQETTVADQQESFSPTVPASTQVENDGTHVADMDIDGAGATKKKRTINRGPKLDSKRLLGARGLPAIDSYFKDIQFKGKGHEFKDLDMLMGKIEHWAHRLYPKYTFDDCLEKIEALGHKKEIQTCLKKVRSGMPIIDEDFQSTVITRDGPNEMEEMKENVDNIFNDESS
ncbi:TIMELESS-interacting protein [Ciona intestinalis]